MSATDEEIESTIFAHSMMETRRETREEIEACNARLSASRDRIAHGPAVDISMNGVAVSVSQYEAHRAGTIRRLRAFCTTCGRCARVGLTPP